MTAFKKKKIKREMRKFMILFLCLLFWSAMTLQAQDELPMTYSIVLGGGITLPHVEGNGNDFFNKNGNRAGYDLMAEGRYYFLSNFGVGVQYDYLNITYRPDKMHLHYIRPNLIFRPLWGNGRQGAFLSLGIGYMDYRERTYKRDSRSGHLYQKGYCGLSWGMGYEFQIVHGVSGMLRADILTADWFANPDSRLFNTDGYDDGVNHSWFKNNITFFNIGFALQWGR